MYDSSPITITNTVYNLKTSVEDALFDKINPFNQGYLQVSEIHKLRYAEYGNPKGIPVIVLHGGPGAGASENDVRFFDPNHYHIIIFDQRGAGRSEPFAELVDNNPQQLVNDIEKLRECLNIEKWLIFGGSWGSTLSIYYGQNHPDRCLGFILRGIFLGRKSEIIQLWYGMQDIIPEAFDEFYNFLPKDERNDLITSYYNRLIDPDPKVYMPAAQAFIKYDLMGSFLLYDKDKNEKILNDENLVLGCAKIFTHYSNNSFFFQEQELLNNIDKIKHLPAIIVHGRYDMVCRAKSAYDLYKAWPGANLVIVQDAGHSALEPGISIELVGATEYMKQL